MKTTKIFALSLAVLLALTLAACTDSESGTPEPSTPSPNQTQGNGDNDSGTDDPIPAENPVLLFIEQFDDFDNLLRLRDNDPSLSDSCDPTLSARGDDTLVLSYTPNDEFSVLNTHGMEHYWSYYWDVDYLDSMGDKLTIVLDSGYTGIYTSFAEFASELERPLLVMQFIDEGGELLYEVEWSGLSRNEQGELWQGDLKYVVTVDRRSEFTRVPDENTVTLVNNTPYDFIPTNIGIGRRSTDGMIGYALLSETPIVPAGGTVVYVLTFSTNEGGFGLFHGKFVGVEDDVWRYGDSIGGNLSDVPPGGTIIIDRVEKFDYLNSGNPDAVGLISASAIRPDGAAITIPEAERPADTQKPPAAPDRRG
ncbi:MAG: hypothetical protein FWG71_10255 [Synergistaceae bacterium]|nr:hypothetical protein [Synergistaceae bacterium]